MFTYSVQGPGIAKTTMAFKKRAVVCTEQDLEEYIVLVYLPGLPSSSSAAAAAASVAECKHR